MAAENLIDLELPVVLDVPADLNEPSEDFPEDASSRISYSLVSLPNTIAPRKSSGFHSEEEVAVNGAWYICPRAIAKIWLVDGGRADMIRRLSSAAREDVA